MKIAIPTHDGITVAPVFRQARGFLVCTVELGQIIQEEIRWNLLSERMTTEDGFYYNLKDCSLIIGKTICDQSVKKFNSDNKKVIITEENLITKILIRYRDEELVRESNITCYP
jgi:predicted Fe-Mo cluster-binding NifX family protein